LLILTQIWESYQSDIKRGRFYTYRCTESEKALRIAADEGLYLTITEINLLGEIDGYELARRIRTFSECQYSLFPLRMNASCLMGFESGADDFITKPFDAEC
jgi:DNA-binding response OmpR family regulator